MDEVTKSNILRKKSRKSSTSGIYSRGKLRVETLVLKTEFRIWLKPVKFGVGPHYVTFGIVLAYSDILQKQYIYPELFIRSKNVKTYQEKAGLMTIQ